MIAVLPYVIHPKTAVLGRAGGGAGKSIVLTQEDLSLDSDGVPKKISFTATVTLRDGMGNEADRQSVSLDYMKP